LEPAALQILLELEMMRRDGECMDGVTGLEKEDGWRAWLFWMERGSVFVWRSGWVSLIISGLDPLCFLQEYFVLSVCLSVTHE